LCLWLTGGLIVEDIFRLRTQCSSSLFTTLFAITYLVRWLCYWCVTYFDL